MNADTMWCHDCDEEVLTWSQFVAHANAGHALMQGRCPGDCQFPFYPAPWDAQGGAQ